MLFRLRAPGAMCVVVVCALLWPAATFAQDDAFKQGLDARSDKRWSAVVDNMRRAIQADARESIRKVRSRLAIFGGGTEYFPYYFLGEALKNLGDCAGAVSAWETSEDQKAVLGHDVFARTMRAGYAECASRGVLLRNEYRQQGNSADQIYDETWAMAERVTKVKTSNPDLWRPDVDAEYERVRTELSLAQSRLVKARLSRLAADFTESKNAVARAAGLLRPLEARLRAAVNTRTLIEQQSQETQQLLAAAEATDRAIDALKVSPSSAVAESRESARASLSRARERLGVADKTQNAAAAEEARRFAQSAQGALNGVLEQLQKMARAGFEKEFQEALSAAHEIFSFVEASFGTLERLISERPSLMKPEASVEREALRKEFDGLRRRFESARRAENLPAIRETTRLVSDARLRLDPLIKTFGPATLRDRGVHAALEQGASLYLHGDYQRALDFLVSSAELEQAPLQVHVHLFRAASLYALFVRSGETHQALRSDALAEIARCKEINPEFRPSPRAFGPRFINFFRNAGVPDAGEAAATASTQ